MRTRAVLAITGTLLLLVACGRQGLNSDNDHSHSPPKHPASTSSSPSPSFTATEPSDSGGGGDDSTTSTDPSATEEADQDTTEHRPQSADQIDGIDQQPLLGLDASKQAGGFDPTQVQQ